MVEQGQKLTKRVVDKLSPPGTGRDRTTWDSELPGFGVRGQGNRLTWTVLYRNAAGRKRRMTLGAVGTLTPEQARKRAKALLGDVAKGRDPAGELREAREQEARAVTVRDLCRAFLASGQGASKSKLAPATVTRHRSSLRHVVKALGRRRLEELQRRDFVRLRSTVAEKVGPIAANRALGAFVTAWSWGQNTGHVDENAPCPASKAGREPERRDRGIALTEAELGRLGAALEPWEGPEADALRVYLLTGCRPIEILAATWADLHSDGRRLMLPDSKTGPRAVYLGEIPAGIIAQQTPIAERNAESPIFASRHQRNRGGHLYSLNNLWRRVKAEAGLDRRVRLYDAGRHTFCTRAYELGYAEHLVRKITGHVESDLGGAHGRYRHLSPSRLLEAAEAASASLWGDWHRETETERDSARNGSGTEFGTAALDAASQR